MESDKAEELICEGGCCLWRWFASIHGPKVGFGRLKSKRKPPFRCHIPIGYGTMAALLHAGWRGLATPCLNSQQASNRACIERAVSLLVQMIILEDLFDVLSLFLL